MTLTLYALLNENSYKLGSNYEHIFTPAVGFPNCNSRGKWTFRKDVKPKEEHYSFLAQQIVKEQEISSLNHVEEFVKKFNKEWMSVKKGARIIAESSEEDLWFNSKSEQYAWLSNFFETLIYSEFKAGIYSDFPKKMIFNSLEKAYQAGKAILSGHDQETIDVIFRCESSLEAKKAGSNIVISDTEKYQLMSELISSKFRQNKILQKQLKDTYPRRLVEHTENSYWGDGTSTSSKEKGIGENKLGEILMRERNFLLNQELSTSDNQNSEIDEI